MANEFKHKDPGVIITQAEYIGACGDGHIFACQATGDILYASSATVLKNLAKGSANEILQIASCKPDWTDSPTLASVAVDNLTINACTITSTAAFTVDATTDIVLDADGDNITFKAGSGDSTGLDFSNSSGTWTVKAGTSDSDLIFQVNDGGTSNTVLTLDGGDSVVYLGGNATKAGELRILEDTDDGANYVAIKAPAIGTSFTLTLPADDGCCGEFLKTDGSGALDWAAAGISGLGSTDNAILRANGTGGATAQGSGITINDCAGIDNVGSIGIGLASTGYPLYIQECTTTAIAFFEHTNAGATQNTILTRHSSGSPADSDIVTSWQMQANDVPTSGCAEVRAIGEFQVLFIDVTRATMDSSMAWKTMNNVNNSNANTTATLTPAGVWTDSSGELHKYYEGTAIELYDGRPCHVILDKILALDVGRYYSSNLERHNACLPESCQKAITERHISPTAEQFWDLFGVGFDPRAWIPRTDEFGNVTYDPPQPGLAPKDMAGVALWGIQELTGNTTVVLTSHEARLKALEAKLEAKSG